MAIPDSFQPQESLGVREKNMNVLKIGLLCFLTVLLSTLLFADDAQPVKGKLGYPVGTELTIEGKYKGGKGSEILVTKINEIELASPQYISTSLNPSKIPKDAFCRFIGVERTFIVESDKDKTGEEPRRQIASGRHFIFEVSKVLAPDGVNLKE